MAAVVLSGGFSVIEAGKIARDFVGKARGAEPGERNAEWEAQVQCVDRRKERYFSKATKPACSKC